jgi:hypothetical protein
MSIFSTSHYWVGRNPYGYLTIGFSPQRLLFGDTGRCNTKPLPLGKVRQAVSRLKKLLEQDGFVVDLQGATISRLDLFCDLSVNSGFSKSIPALLQIRLPHLHVPRIVRGETSDTLYYSNKSREICVYDKAQELLDKGILSRRTCLLTGYSPDRTVRVEYRLRSSRTIRTSLGLSTLGALLKSRRATRVLEQVYNHVTFPIRYALKHSRELRFPTIPAFRGTFPGSKYSYPSQQRSKSMKTLDPSNPNCPLRPAHLLIFSMLPPRGPPGNRDVWGRGAPLQYAVADESPGLARGAGIKPF